MVGSSKRSLRILVLLSILVFVGSFFLAAQSDTSGNSLEALVSGNAIDSVAVLSSLKDEDLPLALSAAEALKFRSLHGEGHLTSQDAEVFKTGVEQKIKTAQTVSLTKTETCTVAVPQRKASIAGQEIIVPAHFRAPEPLQILETKPDSEAGTVFPEIRIIYVSDSMPVSARLLIDEKPVEVINGKGKTFVYRPQLAVNTMLAIGTHTASVALSDSKGRQASASWVFTVGMKPAPIPTPPTDAKVVAALSVPVGTLFPLISSNEVVTVTVRQGSDGKRFFEYSITRNGVSYTTSSLYLFGSTLKNSGRVRGLTISPQVETMFPNVSMTFSYTYDGPGTIVDHYWGFSGFTSSSDIHGTTATAVTSDRICYISCFLTIRTENPGQDPPYIDQQIYVTKGVYPITVAPNPETTRAWVAFRTVKTPATLSCKRVVQSHSSTSPEYGGYFVEGETLPWGDSGRLTINRARWRLVGPNEAVSIEDPVATQTRILFGEPGVAELVHDISMTLTWGDERYDWTYQPATSTLVAALDFRAKTIFKKFPPGIIAKTERKIIADKFEVVINGEKRIFASQADLTINPPWVLAHAQVYPNSPPITLSKLYPVFVTTQPKVVLTALKNFEASLKYDGATYPNSAIPLRMYFYNLWTSKADTIDPDAIELLLPCSEWLSIRTFPTPAELVQVEAKSPSEAIFEGQETDIPVAITPLPGMGTGCLSKEGGVLNLLDGYECHKVDSLTWVAKLLPSSPSNRSPKSENLEIKFIPDQGSGTYEIEASATLTVKEIETGVTGKILGKGSTAAIVQSISVELKSIEFVSNHKLLKKNPISGSMWGDSSDDYETPEWVAGGQNNPISQTKDTKISATIKIRAEPPGIHFDLIGDGPNGYVSFKKTNQISTGDEQTISVTANDNLPNQVGVLNKDIQWKIGINNFERAVSSSKHRIFLTYATPEGSAQTEQRISWACNVCEGKTIPDDIVLAAHSYINTHEPPHFNVATNEWPPGTPPIWMLLDPHFEPGGACIAYSNLLKHISNLLGVASGSLAKIYASSDDDFGPEPCLINERECTVVVVVDHDPEASETNYFEGCLEINNRYYPGYLGALVFTSKREVHNYFASWPNRLVYMTVDNNNLPRLFFDKNHVEYRDPIMIQYKDCIPLP